MSQSVRIIKVDMPDIASPVRINEWQIGESRIGKSGGVIVKIGMRKFIGTILILRGQGAVRGHINLADSNGRLMYRNW